MTFLPSVSQGSGLQTRTTMPRPLLKPEIDHFLYRYFCLTCYLLYACDLWLLVAELLASFIHSFL